MLFFMPEGAFLPFSTPVWLESPYFSATFGSVQAKRLNRQLEKN